MVESKELNEIKKHYNSSSTTNISSFIDCKTEKATAHSSLRENEDYTPIFCQNKTIINVKKNLLEKLRNKAGIIDNLQIPYKNSIQIKSIISFIIQKRNYLVLATNESSILIVDCAANAVVNKIHRDSSINSQMITFYCLVKLSKYCFISGDSQGKIIIWNILTCKLIREITSKGSLDNPNCIFTMKKIPNNQIVTGGRNKSVEVFDISKGVCLYFLEGLNGFVFDIIALNRQFLVFGGNDKTVIMWDYKSYKKKFSMINNTHTESITTILRISDDTFVCGSLDKSFSIIRSENSEGKVLVKKELNEYITKIVLLKDNDCSNSILAIGTWDGNLHLYNYLTDAFVGRFKIGNSAVNSLLVIKGFASTEIRSRFCSVESKKEIYNEFESNTTKEYKYNFLDENNELQNSNNDLLVVATKEISYWKIIKNNFKEQNSKENSNNFKVLQTNSLTLITENSIYSMTFINKNQFCSGGTDKIIRVYNYPSFKLVSQLKGHSGIINKISRIDDTLIASADTNLSIYIWDIKNLSIVNKLNPHSDIITSIITYNINNNNNNNDSKTSLFSLSYDNTIVLFEYDSDKIYFTYTSRKSFMSGTMLSPTLLAAGDSTGRIELLEIISSSLKSRRFVDCYKSVLTCLKVSDNLLAAGLSDHRLVIIDFITGNILLNLLGHHGLITCIVKLSDEEIVTSSNDGSIKTWNFMTGRNILTKHADNLNEGIELILLNTPDNMILSGSNAGRMNLYKCDNEAGKIDLLKSLVNKVLS